MGLFDGISGMISNAMGGGQPGSIANEFMGVLQQHGVNGVGDLVGKFQQAGLGQVAASWVSNGQNHGITADQVQAVLGSSAIASLAAKFGVNPDQVSSLISQHLPGIVDHLTPNGQVEPPDPNA